MQYHGASYAEDVWDVFWYEKNLQGDIVAIYDESGTLLITYTYNAWGEFTTMTHNGGYSTAAYANPFTYRGYYYEESLFMYYLGSRYYDQRAGRFINPDEVMSGTNGSLQGFNLYVYCFNNPVMYTDPNGNWPEWATKVAVIAGVVWVTAAVTAVTAVTFGAGSVAGIAVISTSITVGAQIFELSILQGRKSLSDGDDAEETATDIIDTLYDEIGTIVGVTTAKKSLVMGSKIGLDYGVSRVFEEPYKLSSTLTSTKVNKVFFGLGVAINSAFVITAIFVENPKEYAKLKGYDLK